MPVFGFKPLLSFHILSAIQNHIDTFGRIGPEISFGTVPEFPQKIGTELLFVSKEKGQAKLTEYWAKLGFRRIQGSSLCAMEMSVWRPDDYRDYYA